MPIKIQSELPAKEILEYENIFVMDENRASHQDIRPLQVCILNLMPVKQDTELQLLRALSNTPLQVDVTFLMVTSHVSLNTSANHLNRFYTTFDEIKEKRFDGLIITGAPVEDITFEEVDYWDEVCKIMDWAEQNVTSTLHICWGAQAGFYHYYGIQNEQAVSFCSDCIPIKCRTERYRLFVALMTISLRHTAGIQRHRLQRFINVMRSQYLQSQKKQVYSLHTPKRERRYL